jgi:hypothetical protein
MRISSEDREDREGKRTRTMNTQTAVSVHLIFAISLLCGFALSALSAAAVPSPATAQEIKAGRLAINLDSAGSIVGAKIYDTVWPLTGGTELAGCQTQGGTKEKKHGKSFSFKRTVTDDQGHTAVVTERFMPTRDSVRWEI